MRADLWTRTEAADDAVAAVEDLEAVVDLVGGFFWGAAYETDLGGLRPHAAAQPVAGDQPGARRDAGAGRGGGSFVAVSARPALRPFPGSSAYATAKAAVLAFVKTLDADYRTKGIRATRSCRA